ITAAPGPLTIGDVTLDPSRLEVRLQDQEPIQLTSLECRLLEALMINNGHVLPSETLIAAVWGPEGADRRMLKQLVYRLRKKIEAESVGRIYLETISGVGYAFSEQPHP